MISPEGGLEELKRRALAGDKQAIAELRRSGFFQARRESLGHPLSHAQRRLWVQDQAQGGMTVYNMHMALRLDGPLDAQAFARAVDRLAERHESLRTEFFAGPDGPRQRVIPPPRGMLLVEDVEGADDPEAEALSRAEARAMEPFDLAKAPLARVGLYRLGPGGHVLSVTAHHSVCDGWSFIVLARDLMTLYRDILAGGGDTLPPLAFQYKEYSARQAERLAGPKGRADREWWLERFRVPPEPLDIPLDSVRPRVQGYEGDTVQAVLPAADVQRLRRLGRDHGASLFAVLLALVKVLLHRYTGQEDVVVGTVTAGRNQPDLADQVGFYANTLALRDTVRGREPFPAILDRARATLVDSMARQDYPFDLLVDELDLPRDVSRFPLFDVMVAMESTESQDESLASLRRIAPDLEPSVLTPRAAGTAFDLSFSFYETDSGLHAWVHYNSALFTRQRAGRMAAHLANLARAVSADPYAPVAEHDFLAPEEREFLASVNRTDHALPDRLDLVSLFREQAAERPEAVCLAHGNEAMTYGELDRRSDALARHLAQAHGVGPGQVVAALLDRSALLPTALLGALKAGAAYLPIDPAQPDDRLAFLLEDAAPRAVLATGRDLERIPDSIPAVDPAAEPPDSGEPLPDGPGPRDLACVIYTSGSTGRPKGALLEHRGLVNTCRAFQRAMRLGPDERVLLFASPGFDASVLEMGMALTCGARLVVADRETIQDTAAFGRMLADQGVTGAILPPVYLGLLDPDLVGRLRSLVTAGEQARAEQSALYAGRLRLFNGYGPCEASICVSLFEIAPQARFPGPVPIGLPNPNTRVWLLDQDLRPVPPGFAGELCVAGIGLARGYLNRPEATAQAFVDNPFEPGGRLYRTGDVCRFNRDGLLEYLARGDDQIKVRGQRVEPSEVACRLQELDEVAQAVVLGRKASGGTSELVAWVVPARERLDPVRLRARLAKVLPEYMLPAHFVSLASIPVTPNGKVDRRALPEPEDQPQEPPASAEPTTAAEQALALAWTEVLGLERVGVHDSFFALGGDSIKAIEVAGRLRGRGYGITVKDIFTNPTIAELALAAAETQGTDEDEAGPASGEAPLSPVQRWFLAEHARDRGHFNHMVLLGCGERLDMAALDTALAALNDAHDMLRARYVVRDSAVVQELALPGEPVRATPADLRGEPDPEAALARRVRADCGPFDLEAGRPLRAVAYRLPQGDRLLLCIHHMVVDIVSWSILVEDLERAYTRAAHGLEPDLPPRTLSFPAWTEALERARAAADLAAEAQFLATAVGDPRPLLPVDFEARDAVYGRAGHLSLRVGPDTAGPLLAAARSGMETQYLLLTALARAAARLGGPERPAILLESHGRGPLPGGQEPDLSRTVGWFTALMPRLLDLGPDPDPMRQALHLRESLRRPRDMDHAFGLLRYPGQGTPTLDAALPRAAVNYLGKVGGQGGSGFFSLLDDPGEVQLMGAAMERPQWLEMTMAVLDRGIEVRLAYCRDHYKEETAQGLLDALAEEAATVAERAGSWTAPMLGPANFTWGAMAVGRLAPAELLGVWEKVLARLLDLGFGPGDVEDVYPLTPLQEGMVFHAGLAPDSPAHTLEITMVMEGHPDPDLVDRAWRMVSERHPAMRTLVLPLSEPLQVSLKGYVTPVEVRDLRSDPDGEGLHAARRELDARPYRLGRDHPFRPCLALLPGNRSGFILCTHHTVIDGWSQGVVLAEMGACYQALAEGRAPSLPPALPYSDYVRWLDSLDREGARRFWRDNLAGFTESSGLPRRAAAPGQGRRSDDLEMDLGPERSTALARLAARLDTTTGVVFQALWAILLGRYARRDDVVFGYPTAIRQPDRAGSTVGLCLNTAPVRVRLDRDEPLSGLIRGLTTAQIERDPHQHLSLADILAETELGSELFDHLLLMENFPLDSRDAGLGPHRLADVHGNEEALYGLVVNILPGDTLWLRFSYLRRAYSRGFIESLARGLLRLVDQAIPEGADPRTGHMDPMDPADRALLLEEFNATRADYPARKTPLDLFLDQAGRTPNAEAVRCDGQGLTYAELDAAADRVAGLLARAGVGPGDRVGLMPTRSIRLLPALLGTLKTGASYVPLDVDFPDERIGYMLADSGCPALLADRALLPRCTPEALQGWSGTVLALEDADRLPAEPFASRAEPDRDMYCIYTSGTTGRPKGVRVLHRNVANFLWSMAREPGLEEGDRLASITTICFDISVLELFLPLAVGGTVLLARRDEVLDGGLLAALLERERATALQATPVAWRVLLESGWEGAPGLKALVGGEALPPDLARDLLQRCGQVWNMYGPTETTIWSTAHRVREARATVPIGRPIANTRAYVLDEGMRPLPPGAVGKLWLGGDGVCAGYHGRPELTAERFRPDPFTTDPDALIYDTGDLARWDENGCLSYLGREDFQVKIRGHRIELGELEAALQQHPDVLQAAATAVGGDQPELAAYCVATRPMRASELRPFLARALPSYMVPTHITFLDALPLTPNRKVDRKALPLPTAERGQGRPPSPGAEQLIAQVFQEVLEVRDVGADDDFFRLGGHSLKAMRAVGRLNHVHGMSLALGDLYEAPTPALLAARPGADAGESGDALVPLPEAEDYPASPSQRRLWVFEQMEDGLGAYNVYSIFHLEGPLNPRNLERAATDLVKRHETLRTTFRFRDGELRQVVGPPPDTILHTFDLADEPDPTAAARDMVARTIAAPFDLAQGPLFRFLLLRLGPLEHVLALTIHHIVSDGWSFSVVGEALARSCRIPFRPPALPERPIQYRDFTAWQAARLTRTEPDLLAFWKRTLAGPLPVLDMPTDFPRPAVQRFEGGEIRFRLDRDETEGLDRLARDRGAGLFMALLALFAALLHRHTGQRDFVLGTVAAGRNHPALEDMVGYFVNMIPLRLGVAPDEPFSRLLDAARNVVTDALEHSEYPFDMLLDALELPRDLSRPPLFEVVLNMQDDPPSEPTYGGLAAREFTTPAPPSNRYPLVLNCMRQEDGLDCHLEYATSLFSGERMRRLTQQLKALARGAAQAPDTPVADLPLLPRAELEELDALHGPTRPLPDPALIHERFLLQAKAAPHAPAVVGPLESMDYAALAERVRRLARRFQDMGLAPGDRVAVLLERSSWHAACLFAAPLAGGVYLPLDPATPDRFIRHILADSGARLAVTDRANAARLPEGTAALLAEDLPDGPDPKPVAASPTDAAYLIYTSGSTGLPKGVLAAHGGFVNMAMDQVRLLGVGPDDVTVFFASPSFDASLSELAMTFFSGAALLVMDRDSLLHPAVLAPTLQEYRCTVATLPPAILSVYPAGTFGFLKTLVTAGEAARPELLACYSPPTRCFNGYGPTEFSVCAAMAEIEPGRDYPMGLPLGRPVANARVLVLDKSLRPVPRGCVGEICLSGPGTALGYVNLEEQTRASFVDDPDRPGGRLYRTGDLGRWQDDGQLAFHGRLDDQVKIRGNRVEPGGVEMRLREHPDVREAVVKVVDGPNGTKELAAYVVTEGTTILDMAAHLQRRLPDYMLPASYWFLDELPLTPSGKVDRRALPDPIRTKAPSRKAETPDEARITALFEEMLGVRGLGPDDDFFLLGGDSLKGVRIIQALEDARVTLADLFLARTPALLARRLEEGRGRERPDFAVFSRGERGRVFAVPTWVGLWEAYASLSPLLEGYTLYGLDMPKQDVARSLADLVRAHADGPPALLGYSSGGNLAYHAARLLEDEGMEIKCLVMLDSWRRHRTYRPDENIGREIAANIQRTALPYLDQDAVRLGQDLVDEADDAVPLKAPILYLAAGSDEPDTRLDEQGRLALSRTGWAELTTGGLRRVEGAGRHENMLKPPNSVRNGQLIKRLLDSLF